VPFECSQKAKVMGVIGVMHDRQRDEGFDESNVSLGSHRAPAMWRRRRT
jgi:hypothetical protein